MTGAVGAVAVVGLWGLVVAFVLDRALWRLAARSPAIADRTATGVITAAVARLQPHVTETSGERTAEGPLSLRRRRQRRQRDSDVAEQLPDVVDLLRLTTLAGLPVATAVTAIGRRPGGPVGAAFHDAAIRLGRGAATAEVLPQLVRACGTPVRSFVDALVDHDRYGTPLGPALDRLAVETRLRRRRQAEEAARRLPVLLLFPLVLTTLPAFILLAIVPLLVGSFSSLRL